MTISSGACVLRRLAIALVRDVSIRIEAPTPQSIANFASCRSEAGPGMPTWIGSVMPLADVAASQSMNGCGSKPNCVAKYRLKPARLGELRLAAQRLLDALLADGLAAFGMAGDADLAEAVLGEQAGLQHFEAAVVRGLVGRDVAGDAERVVDAELLAARERTLELLAALELARDDVRRRLEAELLHSARERHDVVDRHAGRVRDVNARCRAAALRESRRACSASCGVISIE